MEKLTKTTSKFYYNLIIAISKNKGIGFKGKLPWEISADMKHFKTVTSKVFCESDTKLNLMSDKFSLSGKELFKEILNEQHELKNPLKNMVVMGKNTWDSLPKKFKPLPDRINVVLSRNKEFLKNNPKQEEKFYTVSSLDNLFELVSELKEKNFLNEVFVIGGTNTYNEFLNNYPELCKVIFQTNIGKDYECDTFFDMPKNFEPIFVSKTFTDGKENTETTFDFRVLLNKEILKNNDLTKNFDKVVNNYFFDQYPKHEEYQYLKHMKDIIENGHSKTDRTGVGTISKFGVRMSFDVSQTFPLITTKDTFWRGIVEELLWFIKADTNAKHLQEKKIHIWDGNSSREYLDGIGLNHREEGDLGPIYGFQWRHFGAEYKTMHDDYTNQGHDQLAQIIKTLKTNPNDRRMIMSAWNPVDLGKMALPPCHVLSQFYVEDENKLSLQMYQRSGDMGLGIPFNIASYSLLLSIVAQVTGLKPGNFIHIIGDAHVYKSHIEAVKKQILRVPKPFPILKINKDVKKLEDFIYKDFTLVNYSYWPKIKMEMAV